MFFFLSIPLSVANSLDFQRISPTHPSFPYFLHTTCSFPRSDGILARRVSLEVPTAYGLDLHDGNLAVACVDSLVRLFSAADLQYIVTLPRPPPLGSANIASIRELQDITDSAAKAATTGAGQPAVEVVADKPVECVPSLGLRYPAALGCRISPSGNKVVCIYADRGLFIWDISDPLCVGKYRSFLAHGACIWDIQRMPGEIMRGREADRWVIV